MRVGDSGTLAKIRANSVERKIRKTSEGHLWHLQPERQPHQIESGACANAVCRKGGLRARRRAG
jgi:hypothetical protein